jgi:hypothetical protein
VAAQEIFIENIEQAGPGMVAYPCNSSYLGEEYRRIAV